MSADRELLELAAKAGGIEHKGWNDSLAHRGNVGLWVGLGERWNSWDNSGDALELAAALGISLTPYPIFNEGARHSVVAKQRRSTDTMRQANPTEVIERYGDDPAAAWRHAITRAAAEVGRAMP